jgi:hypothetical protein
MFNGNHELKIEDGRVIIDRNPKVFEMVLDYLRNNLMEPVFLNGETKQ